MPDLETIAKQPNYDAAASGASKTTIFVFIVTFGYLVFFSGVSSGFIGGIAFVIIGMFVVSLVISMPLFLLKSKFPKIAILSSIIDIGVTVFVTRAAYLLIFSQAGVAAEIESRSFVCTEPLPEFTLSATANPSDVQLGRLCSCIYDGLSVTDRDISKAIRNGKEADVSTDEFQKFTPRFGDAVARCGGYDY